MKLTLGFLKSIENVSSVRVLGVAQLDGRRKIDA